MASKRVRGHLPGRGDHPETGRQRLARQALQVGLRVERLQMARAAMHEEINDPFACAGKVRRLGRACGLAAVPARTAFCRISQSEPAPEPTAGSPGNSRGNGGSERPRPTGRAAEAAVGGRNRNRAERAGLTSIRVP